MVNNVIEVVNYVIAARPSLLNFVIADTSSTSTRVCSIVCQAKGKASSTSSSACRGFQFWSDITELVLFAVNPVRQAGHSSRSVGRHPLPLAVGLFRGPVGPFASGLLPGRDICPDLSDARFYLLAGFLQRLIGRSPQPLDLLLCAVGTVSQCSRFANAHLPRPMLDGVPFGASTVIPKSRI